MFWLNILTVKIIEYTKKTFYEIEFGGHRCTLKPKYPPC